ncbi:CopD family protein [Runella limosa]|uniref:CopD family protein n=1 Tax=Runella limosa TaxID=370978 RepID=UPI00048CCAB2|nr:CopD family protein [Runella limosa]
MRELMLILHFIGLTMGLGTSFAHAFLGIATSNMSNDESTKFQMHSLVLSRMGHIGMALLIISGLYLITPYWSILPSSPLLILKLILVLILVTLIVLISFSTKRAKKGDAETELKKMEQFGKLTLIIGLTIVALAVYIFH